MSLTAQQCEQFWEIADADKDGELTIHELMSALKKYKPNIIDKEVASIFYGIDKNGDKRISKKEFFDEVLGKPKRSETLSIVFKQYDRNNDGMLSSDEIRKVILDSKVFKPEVADKVAREILEQCDTSGDGLISFDEFMSAC